MSFSDDLNNDFEHVFFEDWKDTAFINQFRVVGYLDKNAYRWADIDSTQHIFITPFRGLSLKRNEVYRIKEQQYKYVRHYEQSETTHIVVVPA